MGVCASMCVSLVSPTRKMHAPYYIVGGGRSDCTIFFKLSHKRHFFFSGETLFNSKRG